MQRAAAGADVVLGVYTAGEDGKILVASSPYLVGMAAPVKLLPRRSGPASFPKSMGSVQVNLISAKALPDKAQVLARDLADTAH